MSERCRICGGSISDSEIERAMAGEWGDTPESWGLTQEQVAFYHVECARNDSSFGSTAGEMPDGSIMWVEDK